jgi:hypothetical protein
LQTGWLCLCNILEKLKPGVWLEGGERESVTVIALDLDYGDVKIWSVLKFTELQTPSWKGLFYGLIIFKS